MAVDPKGSCTASHASDPLERPLKTGWLKKQRSIVKNWQQRYFVLKGQYLYYYKVEEDLKPQVGPRRRLQLPKSRWICVLVFGFLGPDVSQGEMTNGRRSRELGAMERLVS